MRRLDALTPYKRALRRITFALRQDPLSLAALNRSAINSMRFMLAAAGISTEGPLGGLKLQGSVIVFANTMETWLEDDDPALARTMARLDRELRRASGCSNARRISAGSPRPCGPWARPCSSGARAATAAGSGSRTRMGATPRRRYEAKGQGQVARGSVHTCEQGRPRRGDLRQWGGAWRINPRRHRRSRSTIS
jgi:hypothetical protein